MSPAREGVATTGEVVIDRHLPAPRRALAFGAHPDDVDFGAGGTLARWRREGGEVTICVLTDGGAGGHDHDAERSGLRRLRRDEQRQAARELGISDVVFLDYVDGAVEVTQRLRRDLSRLIRQRRPDVVLCQNPLRTFTSRVQANHPDHLAAGEAVFCAVYPDARNPFAHPELAAGGLAPHVVPEVWVIGAEQPNRVVEITATVEAKRAALCRHVSQLPAGPEDVRRFVTDEARRTAAAFGLECDEHAEAFQVVVTAEVD